jgi:hypothetical protein
MKKLSFWRYIYLTGGRGGSRIFGDFVEMLMIFSLSLTGSGAVAVCRSTPLPPLVVTMSETRTEWISAEFPQRFCSTYASEWVHHPEEGFVQPCDVPPPPTLLSMKQEEVGPWLLNLPWLDPTYSCRAQLGLPSEVYISRIFCLSPPPPRVSVWEWKCGIRPVQRSTSC